MPPGFQPASYTFVSAGHGWVLGEAPCALPPCTSLLRTRDGGRSWVGVPAPRTPLVSDLRFSGPRTAGVSRVRFADDFDGWIFGPELWVTHDGGAHWTQRPVPGPSPSDSIVAALETNGSTVDAVVFSGVTDQTQAGPAQLYASTAGTDLWSPVEGVHAASSLVESLALHQTAGWLVLPTAAGDTYFVTSDAHDWRTVAFPCAQSSEAGQLGASSTADVVLVCAGTGAAGSQSKSAYASADGGRTFSRVGSLPLPGDLSAVAAASRTTAVVAAASGASYLYASFDDGRTWSEVLMDSQSGGAAWFDLGFTTTTQGEVIEGIPLSGDPQRPSRMLITHDGGHSWSTVTFR